MEPPVGELFGAAGGVIEENGDFSDKSAKSSEKIPVQAGILESSNSNVSQRILVSKLQIRESPTSNLDVHLKNASVYRTTA